MIIPVIFSLVQISDELRYLWTFYKGIDLVKHYGWPLFAQKQYFEEKYMHREKDFRAEASAISNDYDLYTDSDDLRYIQVEFPEDLIQEYMSRFPSTTDAYLASLEHPWPEMTQFMVEKVRELEINRNEQAEAFLCLCSDRFIRDAAAELNIKVLNWEWAPFRAPAYRPAAYLDLTGSICDGELAARFENFKEVSAELPIFRKREILALFLNDENLHYAYDMDPEPEYEVGLGLGYNVPFVFSHLSQMTSTELYIKAQKEIGNGKIGVRYHPGDPVHADIYRGVRDNGTLIDFIRKSRRVACISSGIAYEAMLFNRPVYELGQSQYKYFANTSFKGLPDKIADDVFLSFVAFGYCIPYEFLKRVDYLRWRLSCPSEKEIYLYHLNYYLQYLQIPGSVANLPGTERLEQILHLRKDDIDIHAIDNELMLEQNNEISQLYVKIERQKRYIEKLTKEKTQYQTVYENVIQSRRWRYTSWLVKQVRRFLK